MNQSPDSIDNGNPAPDYAQSQGFFSNQQYGSLVRPASLGLRIMREHAEAICAKLQMISQPGSGTSVILDWQR